MLHGMTNLSLKAAEGMFSSTKLLFFLKWRKPCLLLHWLFLNLDGRLYAAKRHNGLWHFLFCFQSMGKVDSMYFWNSAAMWYMVRSACSCQIKWRGCWITWRATLRYDLVMGCPITQPYIVWRGKSPSENGGRRGWLLQTSCPVAQQGIVQTCRTYIYTCIGIAWLATTIWTVKAVSISFHSPTFPHAVLRNRGKGWLA